MNYQKPEMEILILSGKIDVITMSLGEDTSDAGPSVDFGDNWGI